MGKMKDVLCKAVEGKYAIPAFNFANLDILRGILMGVKNTKSEAILALSESALKFLGGGIVAYAREEAKSFGVNAVLHLDHGMSFDSVKAAIDIGFDSVMIDGSALPYDKNVELTRTVCEYAHKFNVDVEGELGSIGSTDDVVNGKAHFTEPKDVVDFVQKTGVDSLAIAIGTKHGAFKYTAVPENLRFDILHDIEAVLPNFPLVLHGASLVEKDSVAKFENAGGVLASAKGNDGLLSGVANTNVVKINVDTDLRIALTTAYREFLRDNPACIDMREMSKYASSHIAKIVEQRINSFR